MQKAAWSAQYKLAWPEVECCIKSIILLLFILGLKKDLRNVSKSDESGLVAQWAGPIVNHMYWVAASTCPLTTIRWSDTMEAKWLSLAQHICNKHRHSNVLYSKCAHGKPKLGTKKKKYMKQGNTGSRTDFNFLSGGIIQRW